MSEWTPIVLAYIAMGVLSVYSSVAIKVTEVPKGRIMEKSVMYFFGVMMIPVFAFIAKAQANAVASLSSMHAFATWMFVVSVIYAFACVSLFLFYILEGSITRIAKEGEDAENHSDYTPRKKKSIVKQRYGTR